MPRYEYTINGRYFGSKKAVIEFVRENIHSKYKDHEAISEPHLTFMVALLRHHPWSDQKIGAGVRKMWVAPTKQYQTRCFWLERIDGTKTDFSFRQCLELPSEIRDFKQACRQAVAPFVIDLKRRFFQNRLSPLCPILHIPMTLETSHVDHTPPNTFERIVEDFVGQRSVNVKTIALLEHGDGCIGNRFADKKFEKDWIDFHNSRAELRVISVKANLSPFPANGGKGAESK